MAEGVVRILTVYEFGDGTWDATHHWKTEDGEPRDSRISQVSATEVAEFVTREITDEPGHTG